MKLFYTSRKDVVQFVENRLHTLRPSSVLTMTIIRDMSGGFSVVTATGELSADTVLPQSSSDTPMNTLRQITPAG